MPVKTYPRAIITTIILSVLAVPHLVFSQQSTRESGNYGYIERSNVPETKKGTVIIENAGTAQEPLQRDSNLSELQKQARAYRSQGWEMQQIGNLEAAISLYQKAIELDPSYAVAYNDLGVIYEANGAVDMAEDNYLKAIKIDPNYLSPYANLALLYENKRDLEKAAFYWKKRADLGPPLDPWTQKARQRFNDIIAVQRLEIASPQSREQEVIGLTKDIIQRKDAQRENDRELAKELFEKACLSYQKQDDASALQEAVSAQLLDPSNRDIEKFIEKVQHRALSK